MHAGLALEVQQAAERLVEGDLFADGDNGAGDDRLSDPELGFVIALGNAGEELVAGGDA